MNLEAQALKAFKPPFKHLRGYIWDSAGQMVADENLSEVAAEALARVRGWGYLQKLPEGAAVQDTVGDILAEALTLYWSIQLSMQNEVELTIRKEANDNLTLTWSEQHDDQLFSYRSQYGGVSKRSPGLPMSLGTMVYELRKALLEAVDANKST